MGRDSCFIILTAESNLRYRGCLKVSVTERTRVNNANIWPPNFGKFETLYCHRIYNTSVRKNMFKLFIIHLALP